MLRLILSPSQFCWKFRSRVPGCFTCCGEVGGLREAQPSTLPEMLYSLGNGILAGVMGKTSSSFLLVLSAPSH